MFENINNITNNFIEDANYNSETNFFALSEDPIRLVIFIYIILSLILNLIIIIMITLCYSKKYKEYSLTGILTWNILFVNFFHILSYMINWLIKNDNTETIINGRKINIGYLLFGNPSNFQACKAQAFILIFLSISQDFIINTFFIFINMEGKEKRQLFIIILIFAGYIFPFSITMLFNNFDALGIYEKYCYISKYSFSINENNKVEYNDNKNFILFKIIITFIRGINFFLTLFYIFKAGVYIKKSKKQIKKRQKLIYSLPVVIITFLSLFIDLIYKIISFIKPEYETRFNGIHLIIVCLDSILLPLGFSIMHGIYIYLCCLTNTSFINSGNADLDSSIKDMDAETLLNNEDKDSKL